MSVPGSNCHREVDVLHQMIVYVILIYYLLEYQQVFKLEEDPSSFNLVGYALDHRINSLQEHWIFLIVFVFNNHEILRDYLIVYKY